MIQPGSKIAISFNTGTITNPTYGTVTIKGQIPLQLLSGVFKTPRVAMDASFLEENVEELTKEYRNLWPNELDEGIKSRVRDFVTFTSYINPEEEITTPKMRAFISNVFVGFGMDDILDQLVEVSEESLTYKGIKPTTTFFENLFAGKFKSYKELPNPISFLEPLNEFLWKSLKLSEGAIQDYNLKNIHLAEEWSNTSRGFVLLMNHNDFSFQSKLLFGGYVGGLCSILEYLALVRGMNVSQEIRKDMVFIRLKNAFGSASHLMNDVFGLSRDMKLNQVQDSMILSMVKGGMDLQVAFDKILSQMLDDLNDVVVCSRVLKECYDGDEDLNEYLKYINIILDGQLYCYRHIRRYGDLHMEIVGC